MARQSASLESILVALVDRESRRGLVPAESLRHAAAVTLAAGALKCGRLTPARVERYFAAVLRRHLVTSCGGTAAAAHLVVESVVEDLRQSGRDGSEILTELERGWGDRLPVQVLEEWRMRLCA